MHIYETQQFPYTYQARESKTKPVQGTANSSFNHNNLWLSADGRISMTPQTRDAVLTRVSKPVIFEPTHKSPLVWLHPDGYLEAAPFDVPEEITGVLNEVSMGYLTAFEAMLKAERTGFVISKKAVCEVMGLVDLT